MIRIKQDHVAKLIATVYAMSVPVGMGHLHFKSGGLDKDTHILLQTEFANNFARAQAHPADPTWPFPTTLLHMDYIHGRQCKFRISYYRGELLIDDGWYDHSDVQFEELLKSCGVDRSNTLTIGETATS
jgi:hypothetical protein